MNDNSRIGAVVFDMDGVLSDSEPPINAAAGAMFKEWVELVRTCKDAGLKIAFASSADRIKVDANLNKIGLLPEQWDAIVTAENVVKPGPEIFLASAQKLGLPPEQCVVVVDSINGVQAAKAAGIRCVAVAQSFRPEELQAADLVKQKISEVSLSDLVASAVGSSVTVVSAPLPGQAVAAQRALWGIGATLGLGLVIALGFVLAQIAAGIAFSVVAMATGHQEIIREANKLAENGLFLAVTTCGAAPVGIGMTCFFAWLRRGISIRDYLGLKSVAARELVLCCIALLVFAVLSDGLTTLLGRPIVPDVVVGSYKTASFPPLLWLAVVILAPLNEEIFFRGFLFAGFSRSRLGGWGAILLTSVLWSVIHFQYDWYGVATIFASGLLFGYARLKTNSIAPTILMHALMNLGTTIQVELLIRFAGGTN